MNTVKLVAFSVSSVPSVAAVTELRSLEGVFHHKLNSLFFALHDQQLYQSSIQPMGQPPVKHARERSSFSVLNLQHRSSTTGGEISPRRSRYLKA